MPEDTYSAMRQSIINGAPETAAELAQQALASGVAALDAINNGYVPGMHDVGEQFARGQMFLPDMMASAEAMRAAFPSRRGMHRPVKRFADGLLAIIDGSGRGTGRGRRGCLSHIRARRFPT